MSALRAIAGWFVEPLEADAAPRPVFGGPRAVAVPAHARIAVLGSPATAPALAAVLALGARSAAGAPAALVALWRPAGVVPPLPALAAPAFPAARGLAARLVRRDLLATAHGRLVWLARPGGADDGRRALRQAEAAVGDVPVVLALARPREPAIDALLAESALAVVAAAPGSTLADAAVGDLAELRISARAIAPPTGVARLTALAGYRSGETA
jgi:hypothetical protein